MANRIPPIPFKSKMFGANGLLTDQWSKFFRELWFRVGGDTTPPIGGADVITNTNNISDLQLRVEAIEQGPVE